MKASIIFLTLLLNCCLLFGQTSGSLNKRVNANFRNTSIEEILKSLETESLSFVYSPEVFDVKKRVNINRNSEKLSTILNELFIGQQVEIREMNGQIILRKKHLPQPTQTKQSGDTSIVESKSIQKPAEVRQPLSKDTVLSEELKPLELTEPPLNDSLDSFGGNNSRPSTQVLAQASSFIPKSVAKPYVGFNYQANPYVMNFNVDVPRHRVLQSEQKSVWDQISESNQQVKTKKPNQEREEPKRRFRAGLASYTGYTEMNGSPTLLLGGRLMFYPWANLGIGVSGNGFLSMSAFDPSLNAEMRLEGGYGGLAIEYTLFPQSTVHLNFPLTIGAGGYSYLDANDPFASLQSADTNAFFMLEAGIELEINVAKFMKIGFGVSYRDVAGISLLNPDNQQVIFGDTAFEGMSYGLVLKFGRF